MTKVASTPTGGAGEIYIDDDGSTIRFYIKCTNPITNVSGGTYNGINNGSPFSGGFDFPAGAGLVLAAIFGGVTTTRSFSFTMQATGTTGLGGPATVSATINRGTVPGAPNNLPWTNVGPTEAQSNFSPPASNGGVAIDKYRVVMGKTNPPESGVHVEFETTLASNLVTNLDSSSTYYSRVYAHNAQGWGPASAVQAVTTLTPVRRKVGGVYKNAVVYLKVNGEYRPCQPYFKVGGVYKQTL